MYSDDGDCSAARTGRTGGGGAEGDCSAARTGRTGGFLLLDGEKFREEAGAGREEKKRFSRTL